MPRHVIITDEETGSNASVIGNSALYTDMGFLTLVKLGLVPGHKLTHKFGHGLVTTAPTAISSVALYQTPKVNTSLEAVSDDAADTLLGLGAQKIQVQGLVLSGGLFVFQEEEVEMDGLTPVALANDYIRVFRAWISQSGTYATAAAVSSPGTITIQVASGGAEWLSIDEFATGNSAGQSQCALYTIPSNVERAILYSPMFTVDSTKTTSIFFFNRPNADDVVAPYTGARRMVHEWLGVTTANESTKMLPVAMFSGATDMGFMGSVTVGTSEISAEFWLLEIEEGYVQ